MKRFLLFPCFPALIFLICISSAAPNLAAEPVRRQLSFQYDFASGRQGWRGGFADYPAGQKKIYDLQFRRRSLPDELEQDGHGLFISGENRSDDLFMFVRKSIRRLKALTVYDVSLRYTLASEAASNCVGAGGAPGESVTMKAGASKRKPKPIRSSRGLRMNIDKGNQANGGKDMQVVGDAANGNTDCLDRSFRMKSFQTAEGTLQVKSNRRGRLWIILGSDSGFEARSSFYYSSISVELQEIGRAPSQRK